MTIGIANEIIITIILISKLQRINKKVELNGDYYYLLIYYYYTKNRKLLGEGNIIDLIIDELPMAIIKKEATALTKNCLTNPHKKLTDCRGTATSS